MAVVALIVMIGTVAAGVGGFLFIFFGDDDNSFWQGMILLGVALLFVLLLCFLPPLRSGLDSIK